MTTQKQKNRYVFADSESIAAERLRRRGLERFLSSQLLIAAAIGLDAIEARATSVAQDENLSLPPTADDLGLADSSAGGAVSGRVEALEESQPIETRSDIPPQAQQIQDPVGAAGLLPIGDDRSEARPAGGVSASGGGGGEPHGPGIVNASADALHEGSALPSGAQPTGDFMDVDVDLGRLIDLGGGPSLVIEVDLPLIPDASLTLDLFSEDGDQIRLDADAGFLAVHASAFLPALGPATTMLGDTTEMVAAPVLATVTNLAPPVAEQLASTGALADIGTLVIPEEGGDSLNPMFDGQSHTPYGMSLIPDAEPSFDTPLLDNSGELHGLIPDVDASDSGISGSTFTLTSHQEA